MSLSREEKTSDNLNAPLIEKKADIRPAEIKENSLLAEFKLTLDDVVRKSTLADASPHKQTEKIIAAFNDKITHSAVTTVTWNPFRGERVSPDEFLVAHRNQVPELVPYNKKRIALAITGPGTVTDRVAKIKLDTPYFDSKMGSVLLNVPVNHVALATTGTDKTPILFGAGPHVIHDPTFMLEEKTAFVNIMTQNYIAHGNIHILRVPAGKYAKVWINSVPELLPYSPIPYVFKGNFRTAAPGEDNYLVDVSDPYINHGYINRLRVPAGKVAKIWRGTEPVLLESRPEPYEYHDPLFKVEPFGYIDGNANQPVYFKNASDPYIQHGTIHRIRVPAGKVAKVWIGSEARLLESRAEPYEFSDPLFKLEPPYPTKPQELFADSTDKTIVHGNIKRIIPDTGEVAIAYDGGKLEVFGPNEAKERGAVIRTSPTFRFAEFLETNLRTLTFPSDAQKNERRQENKNTPPDEINYEIYTLGDGARLAIKLLVTFEIKDPELAVRRLGNNKEILKHIEMVATADMTKVLQNCNKMDFSSFHHTTPKRTMEEEKRSFDMVSGPSQDDRSYLTILDKVRNALAVDLREYGVELNRLNSEAPKLLDKSSIDQMERASVQATETIVKVAMLENQKKIAEMQAKQDAEVKKIGQDQINASLITAAEAKRQAAELEAKASEIKANADARTTIIAADARATAIEREAKANAEALKLRGDAEAKSLEFTSTAQAKAYDKSPQLFQIAVAGIVGKAVQSMSVTVGSEKALEMVRDLTSFRGLTNSSLFSSVTRAPADTVTPFADPKAPELKSITPPISFSAR